MIVPACVQQVKEAKKPGRSKNWTKLADKLRALMKMRSQWGDLHDIYEVRAASLFEQDPLPPCVRDPNSTFSAYWDLTTVVFLLYVCFMTPIRACFNVNVELFCGMFWVELAIDVSFSGSSLLLTTGTRIR